jgi:hypothetical protein
MKTDTMEVVSDHYFLSHFDNREEDKKFLMDNIKKCLELLEEVDSKWDEIESELE